MLFMEKGEINLMEFYFSRTTNVPHSIYYFTPFFTTTTFYTANRHHFAAKAHRQMRDPRLHKNPNHWLVHEHCAITPNGSFFIFPSTKCTQVCSPGVNVEKQFERQLQNRENCTFSITARRKYTASCCCSMCFCNICAANNWGLIM